MTTFLKYLYILMYAFFSLKIINITKKYTGKSDETEAITEFKQILNSSRMWHNNGSFPSNESDENAFKKCVSPETAEKYCPVRWAAMQRWASYCREVGIKCVSQGLQR
jgi:hypothetical protein